ncbi:MAG: L,D-transpeptidase [Deltaproteobacteria bacterium]|nr:L,D-transpeptidase [Deltaproteobacteria bacterium]
MDRSRHTYALVIAMAAAAAAACTRAQPDPSVQEGGTDDPSGSTSITSGSSANEADAAASADAGPKAPEGPEVYAFTQEAPIFNKMEWPPKDVSKAEADRADVVRLGYLRRGAHAVYKGGAMQKPNCTEGWYELARGGFVCGKFVTTNAHHKELKFAPHAPFLDKNLPYEYGLNLTPGTPLYRRIPKKSERAENEKMLAVGKGKKSSDIAREMKERGEEVPAYLKDADNAKQKSRASFDDLKGDSELVAMRMLKGFYLSLDKKIVGKSGLFWHTVSGHLAPRDHVLLHEPKTEFEGVKLDAQGETRKLPLAWVVATKGHKFTVNASSDDKSVEEGEKIDRFSILQLTGDKQRVRDHLYWKTKDGWWGRDDQLAVVEKPEVPEKVSANEKWIDVDLSQQSLIAFEGEKPVFVTVVSTGRRNSDPEKDHKTPEGTFSIREKHVSTTMDDDGASDGTYRIDDVPWVMYFEKSIALHGAFWHSSFGRERSHGCVNLTPHDAHFIFQWAGPNLPEGWHGVKATKHNPGTKVVVHK